MLPVLALGMVATSCQEEDYGFSQQDVKMSVYQKTYDEVFAGIDKSVFNGIKDAELDLKVNIPGDFSLYITEQRICEENTANVLFDRFDGIEGDGAGYAYKFSLPSHLDSVWVSLATPDNEIWARKVAIQNGVCAATFGEMAQTRAGDGDEWVGYGSFYSSEWYYWHQNQDTSSPIVDATQFYVVTGEYWTQLLSAEYLLAWEDLGGTYDFDFNDVVFSISKDYSNFGKTDAKYEVKVKVLAAGGTMPIAIAIYDNISSPTSPNYQIIEFNGKEDIHEAWGVSTDTRINTTLRNSEANYESLKDLFVTKEPLEGTYTSPTLPASVTSTPLSLWAQSFFLLRKASFYNPGIETDAWDQLSSMYTYKAIQVSKAGEKKQESSTGIITSQRIIIANQNWQWPAEHECILDAYPAVATWAPGKGYAGIWSGVDENDAKINEGSFGDMLTANYNAMRWNAWRGYSQSPFETVAGYYDGSKAIKYFDFTELTDLTSSYYQDFTAPTEGETEPWLYDYAYKTKRLLLPYSMVKDYRYRYTGNEPVTLTNRNTGDTYTAYYPGDEFFVIAVVMYDRPYNESTDLYLESCVHAADFMDGTVDDGGCFMGRFATFSDPTKSAVDITFAEIFLQNLTDTGNTQWGSAYSSEYARTIFPDYTKYANQVPGNEAKVFPIDLMISKNLEENDVKVCTTKAPEAKYYKVFVISNFAPSNFRKAKPSVFRKVKPTGENWQKTKRIRY